MIVTFKMTEVVKQNSESLQEQFTSASSYVKSIALNLTKAQMLEFYGLFKQATEGSCNRPKPSWYEFTEVQKWEAWSSLKDLDSTKAMQLYINKLDLLSPEWKEKPVRSINGWVHHSCMKNNEDIVQDSNKTIFDWVKEKNFAQVKTRSNAIKSEINNLDDNGLSLLHWASDRGSLEIVQYLIEHLNADINIKDENGQTPLHYAASCDHVDVAKYLVKAGADVNLTDNEGKTPFDNN